MALTSRTGLWRLQGAWAIAKYRRDGWFRTPEGRFRAADSASSMQFWPGWEPEVKAQVKANKGLFVDVGANIGYYSVMAARQGNPVIAVEPSPKAFAVLQENIRANGVAVEAYNVAAWYRRQTMRLKPGRHTDVSEIAEEGIPVRAEPLDLILSGRVPSLTKIDAEGSEPWILEGMTETLWRRPKVVFEALSPYKLQRCKDRLRGYEFKRLDRTNWLAS